MLNIKCEKIMYNRNRFFCDGVKCWHHKQESITTDINIVSAKSQSIVFTQDIDVPVNPN